MVLQAYEVEAIIQDSLAGAECSATDLTGTLDHWRVDVYWAGFDSLGLLDQHRVVMEAVRPRMEHSGDGAIHAIEIHTYPKKN